VKEYEYRWDRTFAINRVAYSVVVWAGLFLMPGMMLWMASLNKPGRVILVFAGFIGLVAVCAAVHSRKYWKRLSDRTPQLEIRREYLRAAQLGDQVIPWREVLELRGADEPYQNDASALTLITTRGTITIYIAGLDTSVYTISDQAQAAALASRVRGSE